LPAAAGGDKSDNKGHATLQPTRRRYTIACDSVAQQRNTEIGPIDTGDARIS